MKNYEEYLQLMTIFKEAEKEAQSNYLGKIFYIIVLPRYIDHVYIFVLVNIEIKTLELFTCNVWLHIIRL